MFITENGVSSTQTGLLTREMVLQTKSQRPVDLDRSGYKRIIGGAFSSLRQLGHIFKQNNKAPEESEINKDSESGSGMSAGNMPERKQRLHNFVKK
jgi:hypothetical protein